MLGVYETNDGRLFPVNLKKIFADVVIQVGGPDIAL